MLSGSFRNDIAEAVEMEHPCDDIAGCDIARALHEGFPFVAAFLLSSATETPVLELVVRAHEFNGTAIEAREPFNDRDTSNSAPEGWKEWGEFFAENTTQCPGCNAYSFPEADGVCPNCRGPLPRAPEIEED